MIMLNMFYFLPCSTSDDNLLKNIELFDRLSLRFSGRILFLKDVVGSNEICLWAYYGHGEKKAEVCCTAIVYATDRKHTKVNIRCFINFNKFYHCSFFFSNNFYLNVME